MQALLASVVIFGWPSMLEILVHEGVFDDECTAAEAADTSEACPAQQSQLNLIFVIASSLTLGCSFLNGRCLLSRQFDSAKEAVQERILPAETFSKLLRLPQGGCNYLCSPVIAPS